jgi:hypothetical protein
VLHWFVTKVDLVNKIKIMKKEVIFSIIRHTLTFVGGILIAKGVLDETLYQEISGSLIALIGGVWSVIEKNK